jgi:hypothetical protein
VQQGAQGLGAWGGEGAHDWICFYANGKGVIAHARVASAPQRTPHPKVRHSDKYPWTFRLDKTQLYLTKPVVVDADARANLDAFEKRDQQKAWAWFVQGTHRLTKHDFELLTRPATRQRKLAAV